MIMTISEFKKHCDEKGYNRYTYLTTDQKDDRIVLGTILLSCQFTDMDVCLVPNLISFKDGRNTLTFARVENVELLEGSAQPSFEIRCKDGSKHLILATKQKGGE